METSFGFEGDLRRIADALERLADGLVGLVVAAPNDPGPQFPIIDLDHNYRPIEVPSVPYIAQTAHCLSAVCIYCPAARGVEVDVSDPATCLEYEQDDSVDDLRAALSRHLAHHQRLVDPTGPLVLWTWDDQTCPRCHAEPGQKCVTKSGQPSTSVHSPRWCDHTDEYW